MELQDDDRFIILATDGVSGMSNCYHYTSIDLGKDCDRDNGRRHCVSVIIIDLFDAQYDVATDAVDTEMSWLIAGFWFQLWNVVSFEEAIELVSGEVTAPKMAATLLQHALTLSRDNISIIVNHAIKSNHQQHSIRICLRTLNVSNYY